MRVEDDIGENPRLWAYIKCAFAVATAPPDPGGIFVMTSACAPLFRDGA